MLTGPSAICKALCWASPEETIATIYSNQCKDSTCVEQGQFISFHMLEVTPKRKIRHSRGHVFFVAFLKFSTSNDLFLRSAGPSLEGWLMRSVWWCMHVPIIDNLQILVACSPMPQYPLRIQRTSL